MTIVPGEHRVEHPALRSDIAFKNQTICSKKGNLICSITNTRATLHVVISKWCAICTERQMVDKSANLIALAQQNNRLLLALLQLWVQDQQPLAEPERMEYRLAEAGLTYHEIAQLLGKKPDAVRMLLKRRKA